MIIGIPREIVAEIRNAPGWAAMERDAHTLRYDGAIMNGLMRGRPLTKDTWSNVSIPVLVMSGDASPAWLQNGAKALAGLLQNVQHKTLPEQTHSVNPIVIAPVLKDFFCA